MESFNTKSSLSILNFNSRSICKKLGELYDILNGSLGILHDNICTTETWLNESYPDSLLTNGLPYSVFCHDRNTRSGGSAIFVNSCLFASRIMLPVDLVDLKVVAAEVHTSSQP